MSEPRRPSPWKETASLVDAELRVLVPRGDLAWLESVEQLRPLLEQRLRRRGTGFHDAEDIVADVISDFADKIGRVLEDPRDSYVAYLLTCVRHRATDFWRARGRQQPTDPELLDAASAHTTTGIGEDSAALASDRRAKVEWAAEEIKNMDDVEYDVITKARPDRELVGRLKESKKAKAGRGKKKGKGKRPPKAAGGEKARKRDAGDSAAQKRDENTLRVLRNKWKERLRRKAEKDGIEPRSGGTGGSKGAIVLWNGKSHDGPRSE